ncbi:PEP-CTERM sorting domain-containing protein [Rubritalea tangerina]|uniref:PEP-CTERM sorting domain-containing protein n=2 Tax=Rubritalea tangerina TaxID=430798 RepID=A0ABW4ZFJ7_9BACT
MEMISIGVTFNFAGTMEAGEEYTLTTRVFNPNSSFINVNVELFNLSDNSSLILSSSETLNAGNGNYRTFTLNYTAQATDAGDTLQVVYRGLNVNSTARDFSIDNVGLSVVAVPEPTTTALLGLGGVALLMRRRY